MKRVVAILDNEEQLRTALRSLESSDVNMPDVNVLSGPEGARLLDRSGSSHGLRARLLRLLQRGAYEADTLRAHEQALNDGHHVIYVPVRGEEAVRSVADVLRAAGGRYLLYFGRLSVAQLPS